MNIAIVEDEKEPAQQLIDALNKWGREESESLEISTFTYGEKFLENYNFQYDLVFLDIMLAGITGLETAEKLRKKDQNVMIVFLTNMAQYAIDGYKYSAQDYFVKPFSYYALKMRMDRTKRLLSTNQDMRMTLKLNNGLASISVREIYYIESAAHDTTFHTKKGVFTTRDKSMKQLEEELYPYNFRRCNVSYLVNLKYCIAIKDNDLLIGKDTLSISRAKKKQFMHEMSKYLSGGGNA